MSNEGARFQPVRAIRFIFEYDGDRVSLVTQQAVEMVIAAQDAGPGDTPGYYLDARDADNRTLARAAAPQAFSRSMEVFPERHDEPIQRIDTPRQRGAFTVTLPAVGAADHVTFVQLVSAVERGAASARGAELRTIDLASFPLGAR